MMAGIDPRLLEKSRYGMIPVVSDGLKPFTVYAAEADRAKAAKMPVVAIVIGGLGVGAAKTTDAIMKLPPAVTLAFTPYGSDPAKLAERARAQRHEILLQVPMEPFDYPDNDPGPQTLLTTLSPEQNLDRLYWHLSRFQGYAGIANFMGGRFVVTDAVMQPIVREAAKRGLGYLRRRLGAAQRRRVAGRRPGDAVCQGRCRDRRGADGRGNRPGAGKARKSGEGTRDRGRHRLGAADFDRADRRLDQGARKPWHHACAIDNRDAEIKIQLRSTGRRGVRTEQAHDIGGATARGFDGMARYEDLPYRTCVGMMLINPAGSSSSAAAPAASSMSTNPTSGRCRKAASIPARIPGRPPSANSTRKPASARSRNSARSRTG